ncbi:MAG: zinc ABC transporter substrate-binding protein [Albidovulum sp.]
MRHLKYSLMLLGLWPLNALAEAPVVITDIPVVQSLVAEVMGDLGAPEALVTGGADAHAYQLRPSQAQAVAMADLVFWVGPEMTPWFDRVLQANPDGKAVGLLAAKGTILRHYADHPDDDDHSDDDHSDDHDHEGADPHAWLDPKNAALWLGVIAQALASVDPEHAQIYAQNAKDAQSRVVALGAELDQKLSDAGTRAIVVGHDAYGYFAQRFGLRIAASIEAGDASEPGAARLAEIIAILAAEDIRCVFPEAGQDPKRAGVLVEGSKARLGEALDPEGRALEPGPGLYAGLMRNLADAIAACQAL